MRVQNTKGSADTWVGQQIEASAEYDIGANELSNWRSNDKVIADLSSGDLLIGDGVAYKAAGFEAVAYLLGSKQEVSVHDQPPFSAKTIDGLKLYTRATGKSFAVTVGSNDLLFTIPFANMKFNGIEITNGKVGEKVNLMILDTATGTVTTVPNYLLNQFGFDVNLPEGMYVRESNYDADVFAGLQVKIEIEAIEARDVYVNYLIHELKA